MPQQAIYCYLFGTNNSIRSVIMETHKPIKERSAWHHQKFRKYNWHDAELIMHDNS